MLPTSRAAADAVAFGSLGSMDRGTAKYRIVTDISAIKCVVLKAVSEVLSESVNCILYVWYDQGNVFEAVKAL